MPESAKRKGARSIKEIPPGVLVMLNSGAIESANLVEWLAIDQEQLMERVLTTAGLDEAILPIKVAISQIQKPTTTKLIPVISKVLLLHLKTLPEESRFFEAFLTHTSDMVRSWACYIIGFDDRLNLEQKLDKMKPLAADSNSGVREIAWMALREPLIHELEKAIKLLEAWVSDPDENIRRFATEATRPRGVWAKHIDVLKDQPQLALPLLCPLKADPAKYVQDSVANWLNDASKSQPEWVDQLTKKWLDESDTKATQKIVKRARRTLDKVAK